MNFKNAGITVILTIFIPLIFTGCKSAVDQLTVSTCKVIETNIATCSQLIADDISEKNTNTLSFVDEGEL